jgi:predicted AAA+ superfamily ATPase
MNYIPRTLEARLLSLLSEDVSETGCILVEGARQVGKTTLVRAVLEGSHGPVTALDLEDNHRFRQQIDACEDFQDFCDLLADALDFRPGKGAVLFIDEAQESQGLGRFVRYMKERWQGARVVLTGSSMTRLFRGDTRYPVGRVTRVHVAPFGFPEFLRALDRAELADLLDQGGWQEISPSRHERLLEIYDDYLRVGGMPSVVMTHAWGGNVQESRAALLSDLKEDFLRLFGEDDLDLVMRCLHSVANFVGSPSKTTTVIAQESRPRRRAAEAIFSRLEQWAVVLPSIQKGPSPESAHSYHPKRYLFDTGLLRQLRESAVPGINVLAALKADQRRPLGGILENQAAVALHHDQGQLQGWKRSSSGMEIDFIARVAGRITPVECKAALNIKLTHLKGLRTYLEKYDLPAGCTVSFDRYREIEVDRRQFVNIPAYALESWLKLSS